MVNNGRSQTKKEISGDTQVEFEERSVIKRYSIGIDYKPDKPLSTLIGNLKTVSSRLIRKEYPDLAKQYFYGKPHFWTGSYFVATCGGVTLSQIKKYVENQASPSKETLLR